MKFLQDAFKWKPISLLMVLIGIGVFSCAVNLFVVPNHLYSGGILGLSQLLRSLIQMIFNLDTKFDFSFLIYYLLNLPLFILAYKRISRTFFYRTLLCVTIQSIFMALIPIPSKPLVDDTLTCVIIGGILDGFGMGIILSAGASSGGTDIIGLAVSAKHSGASVGKIGLGINVIIYAISGALWGLPIMIYSIVLSAIGNVTLDQTHLQNISSYATIFTKVHPKELIHFINTELQRDATYVKAVGGYTETPTYITYVALSKYELERLTRHLKDFDEKAFLIKQNGIGVKGEFLKHLDS